MMKGEKEREMENKGKEEEEEKGESSLFSVCLKQSATISRYGPTIHLDR